MSNLLIGVLSAIPYGGGRGYGGGWFAFRPYSEKEWHTAIPAFAGAVALVGAAYSTGVAPSIFAISVAVLGVFSMMGPFWAMPAEILTATSAAAGIAFIYSVGNLGGFVGPYVIGLVRTSTGQFKGGLLLVGTALALSGAAAVMVKPAHKKV